ncbi:MAG: PD-(D/E)XK nuclease family protein [Patescibacteria group bacterium]
MGQNFFEVLGIANIERIHSQMWLYFFNSNFLDNKQKSFILNKLFKTKGKYTNFECFTEYDSIDIFIVADHEYYAIENKVKISQHGNQLSKYYNNLKNKGKARPHCVYLSLIGEDSLNSHWLSRSYSELFSILRKLYFNRPSSLSELIFNEYVDNLRRLVEIFSKFCHNHNNFPQIFWDGGKTREEKIKLMERGYYENEDQKYIALNQLETIFQKSFLLQIVKELRVDLQSDEVPLKKLPQAHIDESHGTALLHIDVLDGRDKRFIFGVQFQSNTAKLVYSKKDYIHSSKSELGKNLGIFKTIGAKLGLKFSPPKTKAYMSLSKPMGDKDIWKNDFNSILHIYKEVLKEYSNLIKKIRLELKN